MIKLGRSFRGGSTSFDAARVATGMLGGKNRLNVSDLNSFSPFQGNPVMNLARGVSPRSSTVNQAVGTGMPSWGL